MVNYQNRRIVIIGLGITGLSCVNFFLDRGVIPLIMDIQLFPRYLKYVPKYVKCCLGMLDRKLILDATLIVVSPGVSLTHPFLVEALKIGIEIIGDIELFVREVNKPIIAITGSSGKSTVTALLSRMVIASGYLVGVGGNIGLPALTLLRKSYQLYILELSSFQLETTYNLYATVSTVLNVSYDHMNRYSSGLSEYRNVKLKIYKNAKICLVNTSDPLTYPTCRSDNNCYVSFGDQYGDYHLGWQQDRCCLMVGDTVLLDCSKMKIFGYHNYMNALAALALADIVMIPRQFSLLVLKNFTGLSHCLELVYENNDVSWINDSKATNINSTIAAINSFLMFKKKGMLHLLLGGYGKCVNFLSLAYWIQKDRIRVYCFGIDRQYLADLRSYDTIVTKNMEQSMHIIGDRVKRTDTVLLSPACSSLDQFESFKARGCFFSYLASKVG